MIFHPGPKFLRRKLSDIRQGEPLRLEDDSVSNPPRYLLYPQPKNGDVDIAVCEANGKWLWLSPRTEVWTPVPDLSPVPFRDIAMGDEFTPWLVQTRVEIKTGDREATVIAGPEAGLHKKFYENIDFLCLRVRPTKPIEWEPIP